jgi:hypothetical protein
MKKALKFTIETQTEESEIISICHLNEKTIALELSDVAKRMFKLNRSLFDKINNTTKLLGGKIYREEITELKPDKNRCGVNLLNKYESKDVEIMSLSFSANMMPKRQSILTKNLNLIDFNPSDLIEQDGISPLDPQRLTFDDVKVSTMVCEIEEIELFQDSGIKTYMLKDFLKDSPSIHKLAYRIELRAATEFEEYVEYIINQLSDSISFLLSYSNSIDASTNYDPKSLKFKKAFSESILKQIGVSEDNGNVDLSSNRIKNSEFGKAALNFYNGSLLLSEDVDKFIYSKVLKGLLPTSKTNPTNILLILKSFMDLVSNIKKQYNISNKDSKSTPSSSKISSRKSDIRVFVSATSNVISVEREVLGYNVFSERQTGLNKFTTSAYRDRIRSEASKYYPSLDIADQSNFMTTNERTRFSNLSNAQSFITPSNLVMGKKKITCSRGTNNISVDDIRQFRVAKSVRAIQLNQTNYPVGLSKSGISRNVMSDFNITIGNPKKGILERSVDEEIDPLMEASLYLGSKSFFISNTPELILRNYRSILENEDFRILAIVSDIVPARFLTQPKSIDSVKEFQMSNRKSKIRRLVAEKSIELDMIPPQIKSMMTKSFQSNPEIDPLKNRESRSIIDETQKNVFLVKALTGFEFDADGFADLNKPILKDMNETSLSGRPILAKAYNYEVPQLGVIKDKFMPTIYNNLLYIRG